MRASTVIGIALAAAFFGAMLARHDCGCSSWVWSPFGNHLSPGIRGRISGWWHGRPGEPFHKHHFHRTIVGACVCMCSSLAAWRHGR